MAVVTFSNIKGGGGGAPSGITFLNSDYSLEFIESAVTEAVDSAMTGYTRTEDFATINGSAITEGGNIEIETGGNYSAGTNIDITDDVISVTGITVPTKVSDLENDEGYITGITSGDVTDALGFTPISGVDLSDYYTSAQTNTAIENAVSGKMDTSAMSAYSTTEQVNEAILSAKTEVEAEIPSKVSDLQNDLNFVNSGDVQTQIENSISGKQDVLVSGVNIKTINNESILGSGNIEIQGGGAEYEAGQNIAIDANNVISVTGINSYTGITSEDVVDALGFTPISGVDLSDYYTKEEVDAEITASTSAFTTSGEVQSQINDSISGLASTQYVDDSVSGLASEQYVQNAVSGKADSSRVEEIEQVTASALTELENTKLDASAMSAYSTTVEIEGMISSATSGFATEQYVDNSVSGLASETYVQNSISGLASTQYVDNSVSGKADISSLSAYTTSSDVKTQIESYGYVNSGEVETQITDKGYITGYTETDPVFQASPASGISAQDILDWDSKLDSSDLEPYYTSAQTESAITEAVSGLASTQYVDDSVSGKADTSAMTEYYTSAQTDTQIANAVSGKQDTLISGTNIKTINNESILGSGNIVISGGSGSANIIELTQAEYDALTAYTPDAMYVITDAEEINMDNYATTGDIQTALVDYYTSAQTDTQISNAVSGKTDKVSVTANTGRQFPRWNSQGVVTGTTGNTVYERNFSVNGKSKTMLQTTNSDLPSIYAPTTAGSAGQPLLSNGSGAPVWGSYKFQFISQSQYDALVTKDSSTIYFIVNEN